LNGEKTVVINCGIADYYIVIATAGPGKGRAGLEAFVVDGSLRGVACEPRREALCFRNSPIGAMRFDNVAVPPEGAVGGEGSGYLLVMETLDKGRPLVGACCVGAARRVFDIILAHAKSRKQFGIALYSFQGVSFKLADFSVRIRAATLLYRECLSRIDRGEGFTMEASMAKLYASETLRDIASFGLELMGQRGYCEENAVHEIFHASQLLISIDGSSNVQRMVIASQL
ncbi:MAG TPA: hypothetical protein ENN21_04615, partial [Spirochaetes bacterium]|nr:hypothetical protein [Spirochaetota bacterium]